MNPKKTKPVCRMQRFAAVLTAAAMTAAAVQKRSIRAREKLKKMLSEAGINY